MCGDGPTVRDTLHGFVRRWQRPTRRPTPQVLSTGRVEAGGLARHRRLPGPRLPRHRELVEAHLAEVIVTTSASNAAPTSSETAVAYFCRMNRASPCAEEDHGDWPDGSLPAPTRGHGRSRPWLWPAGCQRSPPTRVAAEPARTGRRRAGDRHRSACGGPRPDVGIIARGRDACGWHPTFGDRSAPQGAPPAGTAAAPARRSGRRWAAPIGWDARRVCRHRRGTAGRGWRRGGRPVRPATVWSS